MARTRTSSGTKEKLSSTSARGSAAARALRNKSAEVASNELTDLVLRACGVARDAVFNVRDFLTNNSRMAFLAIKDCEKELDQIERRIDERMPGAISRVGESKARQLLACLKFITDLERIGDLA